MRCLYESTTRTKFLTSSSSSRSKRILFIQLFILLLLFRSSNTIQSFTSARNNIIPSLLTTPSSSTTTTTTSIENSVCPSTTITETFTTDDGSDINNSNNNDYKMTPQSILLQQQQPKRFRTIQRVLSRPSAHWVGDGFRVIPVFDSLAFTNEVSPLLMFDYAEPRHFPPQLASTTSTSKSSSSVNDSKQIKPLGVGQHPHRGFETVTIAFQGEVEHHDNTGNTGIIYPGDVQWMTAGRGIIHEEYHSKQFTMNGGMFEMCQLWVNLPKRYKMTKPNYQAIMNEQIPIVNLPLDNDTNTVLGTVRIIAGEFNETKGAATTFSPIQLWDIALPIKDSIIQLPYPSHHRGMIFVRRGSVEVMNGGSGSGGKVLRLQDVGMLRQLTDDDIADAVDTTTSGTKSGTTTSMIRIRVLETNSSILVLGGEPIHEPIAAQGPFVMNTQQEIVQAMNDYRSGRFANHRN